MVIYPDVIFLVNFISVYVMLYILGRAVYSISPSKIRLSIASVVGGMSAAVVFCVKMSVFPAYFIRIASIVLMSAAAFYNGKRGFCGQLAWLLLISGILVFMMMLITAIIRATTEIVIRNGVVYFSLPPKIFAASFIISYAALAVVIRIIKSRRDKKYYLISITHNTRTITLTALYDSGNLLKDPVSGECVNILEWSEAKKLFDVDIPFDEIINHAEEMKLRVIPYNSLGKSSGVLFAFRAERLKIPDSGREYINPFIALYGGVLSKNKEYHALLNAGLF